jgi:GMP synthase-like glutamine amidotransferase
MSRKIGILVTNTDESAFAQRHPKDGEKYATLIHAVRPDWRVIPYQVINGVFPRDANECDGYVITGSPSSVNGPEPWINTLMDFIRDIGAAKIPTVGCCFGHQAIAKALGGTVSKNPGGWGFGLAPTHFSSHESWMQPAVGRINLYAAHSEQVTNLPRDAVVLGGDTFCPAASFLIGTTFLTTQYHPEMTKDFFAGIIDEFSGTIGETAATKAREQIKAPDDSGIFAEWMVRFLEMSGSLSGAHHPS